MNYDNKSKDELIAELILLQQKYNSLNELTLKETTEKYRLFADNVNDMISQHAPDGTYLYLSPSCRNILGYDPEELIGVNPYTLFHPDDIAAIVKSHETLIKTPDNYMVTYRIKRKDGQYTWVETNNKTIRNASNDSILQIICISRDINERKRVETELIKAKERAEESDRLKTAFLQNMSHEIRTPMNAIMGFSDILKDYYNDKPKLEKFTEIISQRCNDLLDIINDILDIAKIESGQLSVNCEDCNLKLLFAELSLFFSEYQKRIGKQHIKFSLQALINPEENVIVTDKTKLKQIFINLISNAFKFTIEGSINFGCKFDEQHNLIFFVSDTGIGIPSDKQEVIFDRFIQLNVLSTQTMNGTGLGLSIVKGLVKILGGEISVKSELFKGSTFSFSIPFQTKHLFINEVCEPDKTEVLMFSEQVLLIVEDDKYNAAYLNEILTGKGLKIIMATTGLHAVTLAISQHIDLILMDICLPDINGYEATRQIRLQKSNLKIIAQTAYASETEKQKALDAGCSDYISKPLRHDLLLSMIYKHLGK